jgi:hypothetical protein
LENLKTFITIISKILVGLPRVRICFGPYQSFDKFFINFTSQEYISTYQESLHKLISVVTFVRPQCRWMWSRGRWGLGRSNWCIGSVLFRFLAFDEKKWPTRHGQIFFCMIWNAHVLARYFFSTGSTELEPIFISYKHDSLRFLFRIWRHLVFVS